ncbi:MAG: sulfide/dihydroorotate dehydrogenase-like FAD/NAD-binding protein [Bacteroidales bacterium]|nr:sulfide/dihydroorotate dehydrogenase-like FAD/NAD-binding protein [Bacteroidales bacterium]MBR3450009.1 sulfide/dihydroorotate dehydrogenase-like FAD/NAD-binding protein [Bacteroidales bacterium]
MYKILRKEMLTPTICLMDVEAPRIAAAALPGQFLIVRAREQGERIPLTICDYDRDGGTVTIVTQIVGASSRMICALETGEALVDVVGPLGRPSDFVEMPDEALKGRRYLFVAGGLGTAPVYPQAKYLHERGARVDIVVGAKTADLLILRREMASVCDHLYLCTDDGSEGHPGLVTEKVKLLLAEGREYDQAVAIGPMIMMKFVTLTLKGSGIPLVVSLNTLMVDGTGMCGCCRITVDGKVRFACVEGPEFDAYAVDFDEALRRQTIYRPQEIEADHKCKIGRN